MAIKVTQLSFTYPSNHRGLSDVNLEIEAGKKTAILGVNGSGKSTLLYHLNGINLPQSGSVKVLNMEVNKKNLKKIRREVGFLFDYPDHQLFSTTAYRDIKFGLDNYNFPEKDKADLIQQMAHYLNIENLLEEPPFQLSLGQKKKIALAGILILSPSIIVCDEPFSGLDGQSLQHFKDLLSDWVAMGKTIVFSTHDVDLTYEWADHVVILEKGKMVKCGTVSEVLMSESTYLETGLNKPMLYDLFQQSEHKPRNILEAKDFFNSRR